MPFLFVPSLVIFFHELGHFLIACWCGVKVETFSLGFGPELLGFDDRYETHWRIAALLLDCRLRASREHARPRSLSNLRSNHPGGDVDREGEHRAVEKERQDAMNERRPPHRPRGNVDIGGLTRDPDHVGKI